MLDSTATLLVATSNPGKLLELRELLTGSSINIKSLVDFPFAVEVQETGSTFEANAILKAQGYALQTGLPTLADDSGLEIQALNGRPGVRSARYGGNVSFEKKIELLLSEIETLGPSNRRARFVCSIAISDLNGEILHTESGVCRGQIALQPCGTGGFGYDPVFIPDGYDETFGELPKSIKHKIGHRGQAFAKIIPYLRDFMAV